MEEIRDQLEEVFMDILKVERPLDEELSSGDVRSWDSLNHVVLINKIEERFGISFDLDEMLEMQSFGEICQAVQKKVSQ